MRAYTSAFAIFIHFAGSLVLAAIALTFVFFIWCPGPLAGAVGVSGIIWLLLGVDLLLGPLLTAVVYKPGKSGLVFDLSVIVVIQLAAFGYGFSAIAAARPAWLVYSGYRFDLVQANELDHRFLADTPLAYRHAPWFGPGWVAARPPADTQKRNQLIFESVGGGFDMPQRPDLYVPLGQERELIKRRAIALEKLGTMHGENALRELRVSWPEADGYFPLLAKSRHMSVLVNRDRGGVVAVVDLKPFE